MRASPRLNRRWVYEPLFMTIGFWGTVIGIGLAVFYFLYEGLGLVLLALLAGLVLLFAWRERRPSRERVS